MPPDPKPKTPSSWAIEAARDIDHHWHYAKDRPTVSEIVAYIERSYRKATDAA